MRRKIVEWMYDQRKQCAHPPAHPALFSRAPYPMVAYDHQDALCVPVKKYLLYLRRCTQYDVWLEVIATRPTNLAATGPASPPAGVHQLRSQPMPPTTYL